MLKSIESLNRVSIPTAEEIAGWDEATAAKAKVVDGVLAQLDLGSEVEVYIDPKGSSVTDEDGKESTVYDAYAIKCKKPAAYNKLINAAEKQEYDEENLGEMTCIHRKGRQNPEDEEVKVHDDFISYVKVGLHAIGF